MSVLLNIEVEEKSFNRHIEDIEELSNAVCKEVFAEIKPKIEKTGKPIVVGLTLTNDENIKELNKNFRGKDKATNVLSFANVDDDFFEAEAKCYPEIELGDIVISCQTLEKEAEEQNITFADHYCHLLTHGLLHLLGFDHLQEEDAAVMESKEIKILRKLGVNNPYEE